MDKHPLYRTWVNMRQRCYNKNHKAYSSYGGRGIYVCYDWHDFNLFYGWAIRKWKPGLFLDRKNNDGHYTPNNCRFVTVGESNLNRRYTGVSLCTETGKWRARYKKKYLGRFWLKQEALNAVKQERLNDT